MSQLNERLDALRELLQSQEFLEGKDPSEINPETREFIKYNKMDKKEDVSILTHPLVLMKNVDPFVNRISFRK